MTAIIDYVAENKKREELKKIEKIAKEKRYNQEILPYIPTGNRKFRRKK